MADIGSTETQQSWQPVSWGVKFVILAGGPTVAMASALIAPVLPQIEKELARSAWDAFLVKQLVGMALAAMVVGALSTGFLSDRIGIRRILMLNYGLYAAAGAAGFFISDLYLLLLSRFLVGMAGAGAITASIIVINARMRPSERPTWMGRYISVAMISSVIFQPLGGILADWNWHLPFLLYAIAAPVVVIAAFSFDDDRLTAKTASAPKEPPIFKGFPFRFAVLGLLLGTIMYLPIIYSPYLMRDLGFGKPSVISYVLTGDIIAGSITALFFGRARRILSEHGAYAFCLFCAGFGTLITALAPSFIFLVIGMVMMGMGVSWFFPNLMISIGSRVEPNQQGRAAGLIKAAVYLGSPVSMFGAEPLYHAYGPRSAMMAASLVALTLLLLIVYRMAALKRPAMLRNRSAVVGSAH